MTVDALKDWLTVETHPPLTVPGDSVAAVLLVLAVTALAEAGPEGLALLRAAIGLPVLLLVPGFAFATAVFPGRHVSDVRAAVAGSQREGAGRRQSITWRERVALSFGLSVTLVPLLGVVVIWHVGTLSQDAVLLALNVFVLLAAVASAVRRNGLPADERFRVPYRRWLAGARARATAGESALGVALTVLLVLSVVAAVGTMGVALLSPQNGEAYTSATLLTERPNGELVATGYPTEFTHGDGEPLVLQVENREGVQTSYAVVVELQRLSADGSATVTDEQTLLRRQATVRPGETWTAPHTVAPTMTGTDLRLTYYLYRGEPPRDPSEETAYRTLFHWISVADGVESG